MKATDLAWASEAPARDVCEAEPLGPNHQTGAPYHNQSLTLALAPDLADRSRLGL